MDAATPPDTSELGEPLRRIRDSMDCLHGELDGFVQGRTRELKGNEKRSRLYHLLYDIDVELSVIDRLRSKDLPALQRHVTAAMKKEILKLALAVYSFRKLLSPIAARLDGDEDAVRFRLKILNGAIDALVSEVIYDCEKPETAEAISDALTDVEFGHAQRLKEAIGMLDEAQRSWEEIIERLCGR